MKTALLVPLTAGVTLLAGTDVRADRTTFDDTKTRVALPLPQAPFIDGVISGAEWDRAEGGVGRYWRTDFDAGLTDSVRGANVVGEVINAPSDANDLQADLFAGHDDVLGEVNLKFTSRSGQNYGVQRSLDLKGWSEIDDVTGLPGTTSYTDSNPPANADEVFYRVRENN